MSKLTIKRSSEWNNRGRNFGIYLDGNKIGIIGNGEMKGFELEAGTHKIISKIDWCSSKTIEFEIGENENKVIKLSGFKYGNVILLIILGIISMFFIGTKIFEINSNFLLAVSLFVFAYPMFFITFGKNRYIRISEPNEI